MEIGLLLLKLVLVSGLASAFDITQLPFSELKLDDKLLGINEYKSQLDTPPSFISSNWFFLMKKGENDAAKIGNGCPDDSTLCGIITASKDSKSSPDLTKPIQLFSLSTENVVYSSDVQSSVIANWKDVPYGERNINVTLSFGCSDSEENQISLESNSIFIEGDLSFTWKNKAFCRKNDKDNGGSGDDKDSKEDAGLGFFGSVIIFVAVIFAAYIIAQAWFNTSTIGSSSDFFNELTDSFLESAASIPRLIGEVIGKITGRNTSVRGGYSAV